MDHALIDITSALFWLVVGAAAFLLAPIRHVTLRRAALAAVNLGFLYLVLNVWVAPVLAGLLALHAALGLIAAQRRALAAAGMALFVAGALFLLHKLPGVSTRLGTGAVNPLLATVGFSYVFLRLIEILRKVWETRQTPDLIGLINYLLPFHMLAAGPIQAYDDYLAAPPLPPSLTPRMVLESVERVAQGLFKKFVLAYVLRQLFLTDFRSEGFLWFVELQVFFLWLYLDFSAYSDIAVGVGRLIGVATPENFNRPYLARNLVDFWDRWHISLSLFIRRNLFIPIQLSLLRARSRSPLLCANVAVGISFLLCGLWHGIGVNFLIWGLVHCVGLMVVNVYRHVLTKLLGPKGVKAYMADRRIRAVATVATFQFVAASLLALFYT
jgi:D-alanyl-lipoteichoic acid acyltransferase DltB (MBOAT superfamily)